MRNERGVIDDLHIPYLEVSIYLKYITPHLTNENSETVVKSEMFRKTFSMKSINYFSK